MIYLSLMRLLPRFVLSNLTFAQSSTKLYWLVETEKWVWNVYSREEVRTSGLYSSSIALALAGLLPQIGYVRLSYSKHSLTRIDAGLLVSALTSGCLSPSLTIYVPLSPPPDSYNGLFDEMALEAHWFDNFLKIFRNSELPSDSESFS